MTILPIIKEPDIRLKHTCAPVKNITPEIQQMLDNMMETMYNAPGIGLAAPQVGILLRMFVMDIENNPLKIINPEIKILSEEVQEHEEGCLSIPEIFVPIFRYTSILLLYTDEEGRTQEIEAYGLHAMCIQHETDHLNGTTFLHYLSPSEKKEILKKLKKKREDDLFESLKKDAPIIKLQNT